MKDITLHGAWDIRAAVPEVFAMLVDFEKWPEYFPGVAESIHATKHEGNYWELNATVKSFGKTFPVTMKTRILPGKGFISDNESLAFGTSGHEELLLSSCPGGTLIDYTYHVAIHKPWLRVLAGPLIGWFSMNYWKKAVIEELRKRLEEHKG